MFNISMLDVVSVQQKSESIKNVYPLSKDIDYRHSWYSIGHYIITLCSIDYSLDLQVDYMIQSYI